MLSIFRKTIIPLAVVGLLVTVFYPVCTTNGQCDYFLLWILVGWPFGIGKMFIWLVPKNFGLAGSMGVFALNIIIGGLIGGVIAGIKVIFAVIWFFVIVSITILKLTFFRASHQKTI